MMTDHFNRPEEDLLSYALDDQADLPETMIVESLKRVIGEDSLRYASFFEAMSLKPSSSSSYASIPVSGPGIYGGFNPRQTGLLKSPQTSALASAKSWRSHVRV
jgi:hypothetical protein